MSTKRLAFIAVTAAFLGAVALSACGGSTSEPPAAEPTPPAETEATIPPPVESTEMTSTDETTTSEETTTAQEPATPGGIQVRVKNGEPVGGAQTIEVRQGDDVRITVRVDEPQELHLHGYEIEKEAEPGTPAVFEFTADLEGIFDLESHVGDTKLVKIIVNP